MATSNQPNVSRGSAPFDLMGAIDESLAEGVYAVDCNGNLIFLNRAAERALGWTEKELLGKNMHEVIHYKRPDGRPFPVEECPLLEVLRTGEVRASDEDHFVRRDGTTFPVAYTSSPIIADGKIAGAVVAFRDVTETKRIERELREQKETLETVS
ncbi:PAS domain S-box protein, partial [Salmonella enterica subsp. enterica serovar Derby]|nr:PAS domain S-box protein [Salmonella enterica subsp. enterica serovar Derby]